MFFETSSKTALNVSKAFDEVGKQLFMNQLELRKSTPTEVLKDDQYGLASPPA
jgi:hypothetical protein